jgi:hypothetical protein
LSRRKVKVNKEGRKEEGKSGKREKARIDEMTRWGRT